MKKHELGTESDKHALVVLSGGQDSFTCFGYAVQVYKTVSAISFNYGQRHSVELDAARDLCARHGVNWRCVNMGRLVADLVTSALTDDRADEESVNGVHPHNDKLPASFVPGRNALFLTLAHAYAQEIGASAIITGVCQTDYSGYPDCREAFVRQMGIALNTGYESNIQILAPLMHLDKAQTFALAAELGFLIEVVEHSHTCYNGDHETRHEWGFGCGHCPACKLRANGFQQYLDKYAHRD